MSKFTARGIVLKETIVNDKDKVLTLFLKDYGKYSVWAKNARSAKSSLIAGSTIFCYSDFVIFDSGKNLTLNEVSLIENFYKLTEDLTPLSYGTYFLELTDKTIQEAIPANDILLLLIKSLLILSKSTTIPAKLVAKIFEIKFLQLNGYTPIINNCTYCNTNIKHFKNIYFGNMGAICQDCIKKEQNITKINISIIYILKHILSSNINNLFNFNTSNTILEKLSVVNKKLLNEHLYVNIKSSSFIESIENMPK